MVQESTQELKQHAIFNRVFLIAAAGPVRDRSLYFEEHHVRLAAAIAPKPALDPDLDLMTNAPRSPSIPGLEEFILENYDTKVEILCQIGIDPGSWTALQKVGREGLFFFSEDWSFSFWYEFRGGNL